MVNGRAEYIAKMSDADIAQVARDVIELCETDAEARIALTVAQCVEARDWRGLCNHLQRLKRLVEQREPKAQVLH